MPSVSKPADIVPVRGSGMLAACFVSDACVPGMSGMWSVSGRSLEAEESIAIEGLKGELLDIMDEISGLAVRMRFATPHRLADLMVQQQVYIDQMIARVRTLPDNVEAMEAGDENVINIMD